MAYYTPTHSSSSRAIYSSALPSPSDTHRPGEVIRVEPTYRTTELSPRPNYISSFSPQPQMLQSHPQYMRRELDLYDSYLNSNDEFTPELKQIIGMYVDNALDTTDALVYSHETLNRPENNAQLARDRAAVQKFHQDLRTEAAMHKYPTVTQTARGSHRRRDEVPTAAAERLERAVLQQRSDEPEPPRSAAGSDLESSAGSEGRHRDHPGPRHERTGPQEAGRAKPGACEEGRDERGFEERDHLKLDHCAFERSDQDQAHRRRPLLGPRSDQVAP